MSEDEVPWQDDAACKGVDPLMFYPGRGEPSHEAKAVCAECPVRVECLDFAMANREIFGIWGGLSERERRRIRRKRYQSLNATIRCDRCGTPFERGGPSSKYCSDPCRRAAIVDRQRAYEVRTGRQKRRSAGSPQADRLGA